MIPTPTLFDNLDDDEVGLLALFLLVAVYMFIEAMNYPDLSGLYPQLLSAIVILCVVLLLFQKYLPGWLQTYIAESNGTLGAPGDTTEDTGDSDAPEDIGKTKYDTAGDDTDQAGTSRAQVLLMLLIGGFLLVSHLISMYFATPLFVIAYGIAFNLDWKETLLLTGVSFGVAHVFLVVFNAPITSGVLL